MTQAVLLVDAERALAEAMAATLDAELGEGTAQVAPDATSCRSILGSQHFDVVILAASLPDEDAFQLCADLTPDTPVLVYPRDQSLERTLLRTLERGGLGILSPEAGIPEMVRTVQAAMRGEACVPRGMLGDVLRHLVTVRRADRDVLARYGQLTHREREVLLALTQGRSIEQIAAERVVSPSTVRSHSQHVLEKLQVHSRAEAIDLALDHGLVDPVSGEVHP